MLTRAEKDVIIEGLNKKITDANAIFLTNVIGLPSNDANALRKSVRDADGTLVVTRNSLFSKAAAGTDAEELLSGLKGTQAVAFAFGDAPGVAKALKECGKEFELVELRGGLLDGKALTPAEVNAIADLPSRDEMLGTLLATFNAPISAFARVLNAIKEQKEAGGEAAPAAAEESAE
ncbi:MULTISPECIES: 50S ribosomal protein L10 [Halobacteriovorax]|uniref:Large ribosomal subunit protein uL10 n=1 Tax=Halobacteriovorax vibrionivorans TaxID=2152716 RepID=A0ABY0IJ34_9BACT|nr:MULTISPECIES: 50S ribosomal protein L10 [Halobacteriovorax]AYF45906.1 50S ribosomal protein L10 [Halobacteriovorax sp. BALOs_7]RZF22943.1 50S ribosomal protein L10 [Halobacteriovorax vibrionivorans]TGD45632.1 50S ribosomal protein L10 [Halobacteriovorax sp. Y22]